MREEGTERVGLWGEGRGRELEVGSESGTRAPQGAAGVLHREEGGAQLGGWGSVAGEAQLGPEVMGSKTRT